MNLFHFTKEGWPENSLVKKLRDHGIDTDYRHEEAAEEWCRGRVILRYNDREKTHSALWRLSFPFWILLVVIVAPLNWCATGQYHIEHGTRIYKFSKAWHNRLFQ